MGHNLWASNKPIIDQLIGQYIGTNFRPKFIGQLPAEIYSQLLTQIHGLQFTDQLSARNFEPFSGPNLWANYRPNFMGKFLEPSFSPNLSAKIYGPIFGPSSIINFNWAKLSKLNYLFFDSLNLLLLVLHFDH